MAGAPEDQPGQADPWCLQGEEVGSGDRVDGAEVWRAAGEAAGINHTRGEAQTGHAGEGG